MKESLEEEALEQEISVKTHLSMELEKPVIGAINGLPWVALCWLNERT